VQGGTPATTTTPATGGKTTMVTPAPATIVVNLPADAKLLIDDVATTSTSATRVFSSPALERGKEYTYTLKAEVNKDGKTMTATKTVTVRAGEETRVTMEPNEQVVAR
jgi:uncharacterized protein (TIGR03000 family)